MPADENIKKLRGMVLTYATGIARRCVEGVTEAGLAGGHIEEKVEAEDVTWEINVVYNAEHDFVRITGRPERDEEHPFSALHAIFGDTDSDHSFQFMLPAAWLPGAVPTTTTEGMLDA